MFGCQLAHGDDVVVDSRMISEMYLHPAHIQPNATKPVVWHFTAWMKSDPKHTAEAVQGVSEDEEMSHSLTAETVTLSQHNRATFSAIEDKTEGRNDND